MYTLLVVDDEEIAVRGIVEGIDWSDMPFDQILSAYDVEEAKQVFQTNEVHVLLSDIDMPNHNGIELLRWVNENSPHTETIFLTGHAEFGYAQAAVQLDSFDYLLKPIDHAQLKQTLSSAIEKIKEEQQAQKFHQTYTYYYEQWNKQLPILAERFWQDVLHKRIPTHRGHLTYAYELYQIPLTPEDQVQLLLISVEEWSETLSARDEEIMTYAIKNAGEEMILQDLNGLLIQEAGGMLYTIVYAPNQETRQRLNRNCEEFIEKCRTYLHCALSCYIDEPVDVANLDRSLRQMTSLERNYLSTGGAVIWRTEQKEEVTQSSFVPDYEIISSLLESRKQNELKMRLQDSFDLLEQSCVDPLILEGYYHGLLHTVNEVITKKSISLREIYPNEEWRLQGTTIKSVQRLREWAIPFLLEAANYIQQHHKTMSVFVQKAITYIDEHLAEDLDRETIAAQVFLNPAYLSRLFKKETGKSLTEYILESRLAKVKPLLETTNQKISEIALSVGFCNFSHFTKTFKKQTGLTPNEYRRKYQHIE